MGTDINIPMSQLERLNTSLGNIVAEFENASSRSDALESDIGTPHGETALRSEVGRFESDWNDKRDTLKSKLESAKERVVDFVTAWTDFDLEAANNLDTTENPPQVGQQPEAR
ncbi:hypothetical protein [Microbacterium oxydans]|uniref:Flagellar protein FlgN n=1 Tax=Microbacterium oxydans TaxID=82380 RepID=A0A0F0LD68_9MICO|nr:hypothetical protein [Microbacterium oxydans]KJL29496.1 hypothetical protein RS83_01513 [Microbacterium oxydans]